ncbi:xanthine dehydrogenase accessory protein XdhC [Polaromonas sp.]|uniref:xanthine dehydrogenase accessory protein XdhC n=1 Tax=Polaromonas sp. TaxID=1869339 RepID=UPI0013B5D6B9|nr:xanthine dehydrogenase accessory protein XdhC [Polaromonas sp.]NDP61271.1 xanthine dehydrogenase accessory protein XdhC [Polaromonas sp.]
MIFSYCAQDAEHFFAGLARQPAVLVRVVSTQGSVPRETGAWMGVFADAVVGTIGGGHLEFEAMARARALLAISGESSVPQSVVSLRLRFALGPSLGQCCGGVVHLAFERVSASDLPALASTLVSPLTPVALFGGGHVGHALARVLVPLPFCLRWIDSRDGVFPQDLPARVVCEHSEPVQSAVPGLAPQSRVLIMSFSHAEDLEIVASCLLRQREQADLPFVGLIGSKTKWAAFRRRLDARGFSPDELAHITCPIGVPGIKGKEPDVIAVAVAAQLLQTLDGPTGRA